MVDTWRMTAQGVAFAATKCMAFVFNAHASNIVRVYRICAFNNQTTSFSGALMTLQVRRITALGSAGTAVTPIPHDPDNTALSSINCGHGYTSQTQVSGVFRQCVLPFDEVLGHSAFNIVAPTWGIMYPYALLWDSGYADSVVQPLTSRQDEGIQLYHSGSSAVGVVDVELEFSHAAS